MENLWRLCTGEAHAVQETLETWKKDDELTINPEKSQARNWKISSFTPTHAKQAKTKAGSCGMPF